MNSENTCPQCHQSLPADAPAGLCPRCLLQQTLAAPPAGTVVRYFGDYELVKEIARLGGDVSKFVTPAVNTALRTRFDG